MEESLHRLVAIDMDKDRMRKAAMKTCGEEIDKLNTGIFEKQLK